MNLEQLATRIRAAKTLAALAAGLALSWASAVSLAATKTVTFGWEDGTSTYLQSFANTPDTTSITGANVTMGTIVDFGPSNDPFDTPVSYPVTPFTGSRMLEVTLDIDDELNSGVDGSTTVAIITNLDAGDTYSFKLRGYDTTDGRSPSVLPNATFSNTSNLTMFDGFAVPLQPFANVTGTGWLEAILDEDGSATPAIVTPITFDPLDSLSDNANAVRLDAGFFYQSLTETSGDGTEELYVDDIEVTVTSNNPDAAICLPDGTCILVNEPAGVDGDYNDDGKVDAADYVVWRDNEGTTNTLPNDPNGGTIDSDQYNTWRANFGDMGGSGSGLASGAVPEPAGLLLVAIGLIGLGIGRSRKR